jgi:hypothetical protein
MKSNSKAPFAERLYEWPILIILTVFYLFAMMYEGKSFFLKIFTSIYARLLTCDQPVKVKKHAFSATPTVEKLYQNQRRHLNSAHGLGIFYFFTKEKDTHKVNPL